MVESSESSSVLERVLFSKHTFPSDSSSSSMCRMHSLFNSPPARQQHPHLLSRRQTFPQSTSHTPNLSPSSSTSSMLSLLRLAATATPKESISNGEHMQAPPTPSSTPPNEAAKIQRNSLYLTFNAPRVDDYVSQSDFSPSSIPNRGWSKINLDVAIIPPPPLFQRPAPASSKL